MAHHKAADGNRPKPVDSVPSTLRTIETISIEAVRLLAESKRVDIRDGKRER